MSHSQLEGNIIVDSILASCYPSTNHDLVHFAMTPAIWFPETIKWIFGEGNRFPTYVKIVEEFGKWMLPEEQTVGY